MIRITHPHPKPGRQRAFGVEFIDGVAEVDAIHVERDRAFRQHGFTITGGDIIDLSSLTRRELVDIATVEGVEFPKRATRQQLIDLLVTDEVTSW